MGNNMKFVYLFKKTLQYDKKRFYKKSNLLANTNAN